MSDLIDQLAEIEPGGRLDTLRRARPVARDNMQASYLALFAPEAAGESLTERERYALAAFVAGMHGESSVAAFYAAGLAERDVDLARAVAAEVSAVDSAGPYGKFPDGPLSVEDTAGPNFAVRDRVALGERLASGFEHAHMLVFHPRDSSAAWLQKLLDAGWSTSGIVTMSQLVAFLAFQLRVVHGLRMMAKAGS